MKKAVYGLLALVTLAPLAAVAQIKAGDLPGNTVWYVHADLRSIRSSEAGAALYARFEDEVVNEVREETGIDIGAEVYSITAFADSDAGSTIVVEGPLTKDTRDKLLALAAQQGPVDAREHKGSGYYFFGDEERIGDNGHEPLEDLEDAVFVSFAIDGKALVTGTEQQMRALLDNKGKIAGAGGHDGALLILSANKALVQAGMQPGGMLGDGGHDGDDWESNIVRNTREAALLVADESGRLAVEAKLVSEDPKMAEAIGGIVNGLIALQSFNSELGPEIRNLLQNTRIAVQANVLSISTVVDPGIVTAILGE